MPFVSVRVRRMLCVLAGLSFSVSLLHAGASPSDLLKSLPLRFEENRGQAPKPTLFVARGPNYELELEPTKNILRWTDANSKPASLETKFVGANSRARLQAEDAMAARTNYFIGDTPQHWHTDIPNYGKLRVAGIYRGIDLVFYGKAGNLEYDFVVEAGADPRSIEFDTSGAEHIRLAPEGDLVLSTGGGEIRWKKPILYQDLPGGRREIQGAFVLTGNRHVHFRVGSYDRRQALVIDPVLTYASYFGAPLDSAVGFERALSVGVDSAGNAYIAGISASDNLPVTPGVVQTAFGGMTANLRYLVGDAFVAKFTAAGALSYVTYLGGTGDDAASAIAVDSAGDAYLTGMTNSSDFPTTTGVLQTKLKGSGGNTCTIFGDAFVAKLNPSGTQLIYSTYLGGSLDDFGAAITIDSLGDAYVAGATRSSDFPVVNAAQHALKGSGGEPGRPSCNGAPLFDSGDAFVAKVNPAATQLLFSTYLGGSLDDAAFAIAVDPAQNVYVGGYTLSSDFPTTNSLQTVFGGIDPQNEFFNFGDGFVVKLNSSGETLTYSTYLGGAGDDAVYGLVADSAGTVYVTGSTSSPNFPVTAMAVQHSYGGYVVLPFLIEQNVGDAFVARLDAQGATLLYSTFFGGSKNDSGQSIAVDPSGLIYVVGWTDSTNFPLTANAVQATFGGDDTRARVNYLPTGDGFLAIIDPNVTTPVYSSYYGGEFNDQFFGVTLDASGNIWMTGSTESPNLKVTANAAQKTYTGGAASSGGPSSSDPIVMQAMIAEFSSPANSLLQVPVSALTFNAAAGGDAPPPQTVDVTPAAGAVLPENFQIVIDGGQANTPAPAWLSVNTATASAPARLVVSVDQGSLSAGKYTGRIQTVDSSGIHSPILVTLVVSNASAKLAVSPSTLRFIARKDKPGTLVQEVLLSNSGGGGSLSVSASVAGGSSWVKTLNPKSGQTTPNSPLSLEVEVSTTGLAAGSYHDSIQVASAAGKVDVPISLFVANSGSALAVNIQGILFQASQNAAPSITREIEILNIGDPTSTVNWTATLVSGSNWLSLASSKGTATPAAPGTLGLTLASGATHLAPGLYYALIKISDPKSLNSVQYVTAMFNLGSSSAVAVPDFAPAGLLFTATAGGASPPAQHVQLNGGSGSVQMATSTIGNGTWLGATISSNTLSVSANPAGLSAGIYSGYVTMSIGEVLRSVNVTFIVSTGSCTPTKLALSESGLGNDFNLASGLPAALNVRLNNNCGSPVTGGNVIATFSNGDTPLALVGDSLGNYSGTWQPSAVNPNTVVTLTASSGSLQAAATLYGSVSQNATPPPTLAPGGTLNDFNPVAGAALSPGMIAEVYGSGLATSQASPGVLPLPTTFKNTFAQVGDDKAPFYFLSSAQINVQIPVDAAAPQQVPMVVSVDNALTLPITLDIIPNAPGVLSAFDGPTPPSTQNGAHILAQHLNGTPVTSNSPGKSGEYLVMYLTGLGATKPSVASGTAASANPLAYVTATPTVTVDSKPSKIYFAGLAPTFVGLYQIDFEVPSGAKSGEDVVTVTQNGVAANSTLLPISQ